MSGEKTHQYPSSSSSKSHVRRSFDPIGPRPPELDDFVSVQPITFKEKFVKKFKENPFVPIGAAATVVALSMGIYNLQSGNAPRQQFFMRARVGAQGFTVVALLLGVIYHKNK